MWCARLVVTYVHSSFSSYTNFSYSNLLVTPGTVHGTENVSVTVTVSNVGKMDGDEVCMSKRAREQEGEKQRDVYV